MYYITKIFNLSGWRILLNKSFTTYAQDIARIIAYKAHVGFSSIINAFFQYMHPKLINYYRTIYRLIDSILVS